MRQEASESSWQYIELVPEGDICDILKGQQDVDLLTNALGNKPFYRYAADKWTAAEVVAHLNDTERVFAFRALWLARGLSDALPGFDQLTVAEWARRAPRDWPALIDEFETLRTATLQLVRPLEESVWTRSGTIADMQTSVRALVRHRWPHGPSRRPAPYVVPLDSSANQAVPHRRLSLPSFVRLLARRGALGEV